MLPFNKTFNDLILEYVPTMPLTTDQYYSELSDYLGQFGMHLGENKFNPDIDYVNRLQKGIYKGKDQIGKIELKINKNTLFLEHIKSYGKYYRQNFGLVSKIYPFHHQMALLHNLVVKTNAVNDITYNKFLETFKDFQIKKTGGKITATPKQNEIQNSSVGV